MAPTGTLIEEKDLSVSPKPKPVQSSGEAASAEAVSELSKELVIGLVGYAGAGCSTAAKRIQNLLYSSGYSVKLIKVSDLIAGAARSDSPVPEVVAGPQEGKMKFERGRVLQDLGDTLRGKYGPHALAALSVGEVRRQRGSAEPGAEKKAFILDSLKHPAEVHLLRRVYDSSFRLVAVHCERQTREKRLIGNAKSTAKFREVDESDVRKFMDRDERDATHNHGQQVRETFHIADFFLDNNAGTSDGSGLTEDVERFVSLLLGTGLVRPTTHERAMYHAHAAALQSACLSRQVGAALTSRDGTILATGANDVPKFGGGVYEEGSTPDHRCFVWEWNNGSIKFTGCHNDRRKKGLRENIAAWLSENLTDKLALAAHPKSDYELDTAEAAREQAKNRIKSIFVDSAELFDGLPGIKDLIEYSRSIHAEMNALLTAGRNGASTVGGTLYCTTYPCHSCARHLVTAGIQRVYYIEPYTKSLASELHSDSISVETSNRLDQSKNMNPNKMIILPFTGVGPRMYADLFVKRGELKGASGVFKSPPGGQPDVAVRMSALNSVEEAAAALVPVDSNG